MTVVPVYALPLASLPWSTGMPRQSRQRHLHGDRDQHREDPFMLSAVPMIVLQRERVEVKGGPTVKLLTFAFLCIVSFRHCPLGLLDCLLS